MHKNTNYEILRDYVNYLNTVCNQTITDSRLVIVNQKYITCFQNRAIHPLILKHKGYLSFHQTVTVHYGKVVVEDYGYRYSLTPDPDDEDQWVFRYEYSLNPEENVPHAHFHVNATKGDENLKHIHFPTERISIEKVIAHLILEHKVQPKREDWFDFLAESHKSFTKLRTDMSQFP